jgi:hypothetical protein
VKIQVIYPAEIPLALGCLLGLVSAVLVVQVMVGLIAFLIGPFALCLLLIGALRARDPELPWARQSLGVLLVIAGLVALVWASALAVESGAALWIRQHRDLQGVTPVPHSPRLMIGFAGALLMGGGLRIGAGWSVTRCMAWACVILLVPFAIFALLRRFGENMVFTA